MIPYAGLSFSTYEHIKKFLLNNRVSGLSVASNNDNSSKTYKQTNMYELTVPGKLICGALTGVVAQTITYPVDVVRRHMQLAVMLKNSSVKEFVDSFFLSCV